MKIGFIVFYNKQSDFENHAETMHDHHFLVRINLKSKWKIHFTIPLHIFLRELAVTTKKLSQCIAPLGFFDAPDGSEFESSKT